MTRVMRPFSEVFGPSYSEQTEMLCHLTWSGMRLDRQRRMLDTYTTDYR